MQESRKTCTTVAALISILLQLAICGVAPPISMQVLSFIAAPCCKLQLVLCLYNILSFMFYVAQIVIPLCRIVAIPRCVNRQIAGLLCVKPCTAVGQRSVNSRWSALDDRADWPLWSGFVVTSSTAGVSEVTRPTSFLAGALLAKIKTPLASRHASHPDRQRRNFSSHATPRHHNN